VHPVECTGPELSSARQTGPIPSPRPLLDSPAPLRRAPQHDVPAIRIDTLILRRLRSLNTVFAWIALAFVALALTGALRSHSPVPHWDMWDGYLDFFTKIHTGRQEAWWAQHNEHRIVLSRLFFWVDLALFQGRGILLVTTNYVLTACTCVLFLHLLAQRVDRSERWLGGFIVAWLFLWIQRNNLTSGFQVQFILAQLLPLCGFWSVHRAAQGRPQSFAWALAFGVLSIGTMANGVVALPLMTAQASLSGLDRQRCLILGLAAVMCSVLYFIGYHTPEGHGSLTHALGTMPLQVMGFTLLYLGSPFATFAGGARFGVLPGIAAGALLIACSVWMMLRFASGARKDTLGLALLTFLAYIIGTAFITAVGRIGLGMDNALASRYTTPALMAWVALLVLMMPAGRPLTVKAHRALVTGCAVLLVPMTVVQAMAVGPRYHTLFERAVGALALELGVRDPMWIARLYPDPDRALAMAVTPRARNWSFFGLLPYRDAGQLIGQPMQTVWPAAARCPADLLSPAAIDGEPRFMRVEGRLAIPDARTKPDLAVLVDAQGVIRGLVFDGRPMPSRASPASTVNRGFVGYVHASAAHEPLAIVDPTGACSTAAADSPGITRTGPRAHE
jgi:hypothetical protein